MAQIVDHSLIAALYFNADSADHVSKDAFATHSAVARNHFRRAESAHVFIAFLTVGELTGAKEALGNVVEEGEEVAYAFGAHRSACAFRAIIYGGGAKLTLEV